jgi:hypothetical protein
VKVNRQLPHTGVREHQLEPTIIETATPDNARCATKEGHELQKDAALRRGREHIKRDNATTCHEQQDARLCLLPWNARACTTKQVKMK